MEFNMEQLEGFLKSSPWLVMSLGVVFLAWIGLRLYAWCILRLHSTPNNPHVSILWKWACNGWFIQLVAIGAIEYLLYRIFIDRFGPKNGAYAFFGSCAAILVLSLRTNHRILGAFEAQWERNFFGVNLTDLAIDGKAEALRDMFLQLRTFLDRHTFLLIPPLNPFGASFRVGEVAARVDSLIALAENPPKGVKLDDPQLQHAKAEFERFVNDYRCLGGRAFTFTLGRILGRLAIALGLGVLGFGIYHLRAIGCFE